MTIWLEKLAVNNSKLKGGKIKNLDEGFTWKTSVRFVFYLQETLNRNENNWTCDMSTRGFLTEILLHIYNVQQAEVISGYLFTFITHNIILTNYENIKSEFSLFPNIYSNYFLTIIMSQPWELFIQS